MFVDTITNITTIINDLQTNFCIMPRALYSVFQIVIGFSPQFAGIGKWGGGGGGGGHFFTGCENLRRSDFDDSNFFQTEKSILQILNIN